jgi:hypothetical protein
MKILSRFIVDQTGSAETGLVLIPVMILFLSVLQLPTSVLSRIVLSAKLQSDTYIQGFINTPKIDGGVPSYSQLSSQTNDVSPGSAELLPMPGGGEIIIKSRKLKAPTVTPLLIGGDEFSAVGITINENS